MPHVYEAQLSDGRRYNVETSHYHEDHHPEDFKRHLLDVLKGAISGVIGGVVVGFIHKGRR